MWRHKYYLEGIRLDGAKQGYEGTDPISKSGYFCNARVYKLGFTTDPCLNSMHNIYNISYYMISA